MAAGFWLAATLLAAEPVPDALKETAAKAETGEADAMVTMAKAYENGTDVRKNLVLALAWYRKAADSGDASAAGKVGEMFEKGQGTKPDAALALRYYLQGSSGEGAGEAIQRLLAADPQLPKKLEAVAPTETQAILAKAAKGEAEAKYDLAQLLFEQNGGLLRDETAGLRWMQQSAEQGYAPAQAWFGSAYGNGDHQQNRANGERFFPEDQPKAIEWLKKAAAQKHPGACYDLGMLLSHGEGVARDYPEAYRLLDVATKGEIEYAESYRDEIAAAHPEAVGGAAGATAQRELQETLRKANAGDAAAAYALWERIQNNRTPTKAESEEAFRWLKQAAEKQHADAMFALSESYREGVLVEANAAERLRLLRAAAEKGSVEAAYQFGLILRDGTGLEKNQIDAFRWLHAAAKKGNKPAAEARDAMLNYELSQAIIAAAPPETQALLKKANGEDARSEYQVGLMFQNGDGGLPPDMLEARNWLQAAATAGLAEAEYAFGEFISQGRLERPDWATAVGWYRKAADQGHADAQLSLGYCYAAGLGVDKDIDQAGFWWRKAAAQGKAEATKAIADAKKDGHVFKDVAVEAMDEFTVLERKYGTEVPAGMKGETRKNFLLQAGTFNTTAIYEIALAYLNGKPEDGVAKDVATGEMWMQRAAASRHPSALAYFEDKANAARTAEAAKRVAAFEEAFSFAPNLHRRKRLVAKFSQAMWISDLPEEEKRDLTMRSIGARAKERPAEAFDYVSAIAGFKLSPTLSEKYLGADLAARIKAAAQKYLDDFNNPNSPSQQEWHSLPAGLTSRASAGDAEAQYQLAKFLFTAQYHRDEGEAIEWLRKSLAGGNAAAGEELRQIGTLALQRGRRALDTRDQPEALRQFLLADELGVHDETETIGYAFETGWMGASDYAKAAEWYRRAADQGDTHGLTALGRLYEGGYGFAKDEAQAAKLYREAGEKGDSAGMTGIARALLFGRGIAKDEAEAVVWFKKAAEKKVAVAIQWLRVLTVKASREDRAELALQTAGSTFYENAGDIFIEPGDLLDYAIALGSTAAKDIRAKWQPLKDWSGDQPDYKAALAAEEKKNRQEALALFTKAAEKGSLLAMRNLGAYYSGGMEGIPENLDEAERWFAKGGEGGLVSAAAGARAIHGFKFFRAGDAARDAGNWAEAIRQWKMGAAMSDAYCLRAMGRVYEDGVDGLVSVDLVAARGFYERVAVFASKDGEAELKRIDARVAGRPQFLLGLRALEGKNASEAVKLFEQAIALGNSDAMEQLGYCYETGKGVTPDVEKAKGLFTQAKNLGNASAAEALEDIEAQKENDKLVGSLKRAQSLANQVDGVSGPAGKAPQAAAKPTTAPDEFDSVDDAVAELGRLARGEGAVQVQAREAMAARDRINASAGQSGTATPEKMLAELRKKAEAGDPQAQLDYAEKLAASDARAAKLWYKKAIDNPRVTKETKQAALTGFTFLPADNPGLVIVADEAKAKAATPEKPLSESELKAKAEAGDALAQYDYGEVLKKKGDTAGASQWFHKALENPSASEEVKKWAEMATMDERLRAQADAAQQAKVQAATAEMVAQAARAKEEKKEPTADDFWTQAQFAFLLSTAKTTSEGDRMKLGEEAQEKLFKAVAIAETGSPETKYRLGGMIMQGSLGVEKNPDRGRLLIVSAAEGGFLPAQLDYAQAMLTGAAGFPKDSAKGSQLLGLVIAQAAAAPANVKHQIAMILFQGAFGVAVDRPRALALLNSAVNEGFPVSQFELGRALMTGLPPDLPADPVRGVVYLKRVANQGAPEAMALLGQVYEQGVGAVAADPVEALAWYEKAEQAGMTQAKAAVERLRAKAPAKK